MYEIKIVRDLNAPIEQVFAQLADHAAYAQFPGVERAQLLREGEQEKNGVGARREVKVGPMTLVEDVTAYRAPELMEYRIVSSKPLNIDHEGGQIHLTANGAQTRVVWTSRFRFTLPLLGGRLGKMLGPRFGKGFASILKSIERRAQLAAQE